ncbi:MAG: hypothetical protein J6B86_01200 [Clostridia bacterium]|nr:hypothetical protein [Clostridia bacterium]
MSYQLFNDVRIPVDRPAQDALAKAKKELRLPASTPAFIYRRSLDTRKDRFSFVYTVAVNTERKDGRLRPFPNYEFPGQVSTPKTIPVVGFGPAGMFCAWLLAKCGHHPIVVERGQPLEQRIHAVEQFWNGGVLNPESNVQFGEGGAGTFSDGKLTTRINDPRCRKILETFVSFGAPEEILTLAKPHIGTDRLRNVVKALREEILALGGEIRFNTKLTDLTIENGELQAIWLNGERFDTDVAVIAVGNGARDTYEMMLSKPLSIEAKPFSVGFRVEHSQEALNAKIYGKYNGTPSLGAADYLFSHVTDKAASEAVYSFCMCPGGQVVNASSLPGQLTTNGMSRYARDGENANAAILASVRPATVQEGLDLQKTIETAAFAVAQGMGPATTEKAFLNQETPDRLDGINPTFLPGVVPFDINELFPADVSARLREGFSKFQDRILGNEPAILTAPETRTSAPLRILRNPDTLQAVGGRGLYPCGEGAGYAGGIMSSAVDGIRVAEQIIQGKEA